MDAVKVDFNVDTRRLTKLVEALKLVCNEGVRAGVITEPEAQELAKNSLSRLNNWNVIKELATLSPVRETR